ncbi:MAG: hypothetical protein JOZ07_02470 [Solirubrobacterales bacterium]|nr:hypothetical protein [Solirubrobacterales bacterium]
MQRDAETLSTRDLASPADPAAEPSVPAPGSAEESAGPVTPEQSARPVAPEQSAGAVVRKQSAAPVAPEPSAAPVAPEPSARPVAPEESAAPTTAEPRAATAEPRAATAESGAATAESGAAMPESGSVANDPDPLLTADSTATLRRRWDEVQTRFVDEPRAAVEEADGLVANAMQQLADGFAAERERLEAQWDRGEDISTEDLRVALQRYRSFFRRILST